SYGLSDQNVLKPQGEPASGFEASHRPSTSHCAPCAKLLTRTNLLPQLAMVFLHSGHSRPGISIAAPLSAEQLPAKNRGAPSLIVRGGAGWDTWERSEAHPTEEAVQRL